MAKPDIRIGTTGWRHEAWNSSFYPDDLPHEWRLTYYSNEFDSVLVPADYLTGADPESLHTWIEDTNESFTFFVELPLGASSAWTEKVCAPLAPRLGGIVFKATIPSADLIETARRYAPVVVDWEALQANDEAVAAQHNLGRYWRPDERNTSECSGELGIAELSSSVTHDPKALKNVLEHCRSLRGATTIGVFFGGDNPDIEEIRNAIMILQMMA
jgi:hypothetical protein